MSSERLDQSTKLPLGTRDAVHVPIIAAKLDPKEKYYGQIDAGSFVKFTDPEFTLFTICQKENAHGIINPFLDEVNFYDTVVILLLPGITTPVRHAFNIDVSQKERERSILEIELEEARKSDPDCASCWIIHNNEIVRM